MVEYFFDSYAVIELIKGNPAYIKYLGSKVTITFLNLVEVTNSVLIDYGEERARVAHDKFKECVQDVEWNVILEALRLKQKYKKRSLSYADCVGYAFANQNGLRFLTGDKGFDDLENVEFVK